MRWLVLSLALVLGCSTGLPIGGGYPDGSGVRDAGPADLPRPVDLPAPYDGPTPDLPAPLDLSVPPRSCNANCVACPANSCCEGKDQECCRQGEYCDSTGQCRCGMEPACAENQICAAGGPQPGPGASSCGFVCCGDLAHPCPL